MNSHLDINVGHNRSIVLKQKSDQSRSNPKTGQIDAGEPLELELLNEDSSSFIDGSGCGHEFESPEYALNDS